jgi:hypothetical protein
MANYAPIFPMRFARCPSPSFANTLKPMRLAAAVAQPSRQKGCGVQSGPRMT